MGLITSVDYINRNLEAERKDKRQKEAEKRQQEMIKDVCINYLKTQYIENNYSLDEQTIALLEDKFLVRKEVTAILKEEYKIKLDNNYFDKNYLNWLLESKKEFELIEKLKSKQEKELEKINKDIEKEKKEIQKDNEKMQKEFAKRQKEEEKELEAKRIKKAETIGKIIGITAVIAMFPLMLVLGIAKAMITK